MFVGLCLVNAYRRRKLEGARVVLPAGMAANGVAVGSCQAIAWVSIARRAVTYANAAYGAGLLIAGDGCARQAGELGRHFGCRFAQTPSQQRGVAAFVVYRMLRENVAYRLEEAFSRTIRIVDGTIVREPGKTGSQWRILYCIRLPSLECDFFELAAAIGEGSGESLNRLPVVPHELILADAGYCSIAGIEYVWQHAADVLVRINPQTFVAYSVYGRRISLLPRLRTLSKVGQFRKWRVVLHVQGSTFAGRLCAVRKSDCAIQQTHRRLQRKASKKQMIHQAGNARIC